MYNYTFAMKLCDIFVGAAAFTGLQVAVMAEIIYTLLIHTIHVHPAPPPCPRVTVTAPCRMLPAVLIASTFPQQLLCTGHRYDAKLMHYWNPHHWHLEPQQSITVCLKNLNIMLP